MNNIAQQLINSEKVQSFLRAVRADADCRLTVENTDDGTEITVGEAIKVYLTPVGQTKRSDFATITAALTHLLALEYELRDLTLELTNLYEEITLLYRLSSSFSGSLQSEQIQSVALEEIAEVLDVEKATILLLDDEQQKLTVTSGLGIAPDKVGKFGFTKGTGLAWKVIESGLSMIIEDPQSEVDYVESDEPEHSMLMVPIPSKKGFVGVMAVSNKADNDTFDSKDEKLLAAIAQQMGAMLENASLYKETKELFLNTVEALSAAIDAKDPYTHGHSRRVTEFSVAIAEEMGLSFDQIENIRISALLHDVGKLGVSEAILRKPDKLNDEEFAQIKMHPGIGAEIMMHVKKLSRFLPGMIDHHEKFSGGGYPAGLKQDQISLPGRIIAVADTFDAITSNRPYHKDCKGKPDSVAIEELKRCSGNQFEPAIVEGFLKAYEKGKIISQQSESQHD